ncbi:MAG TPA: prepilin-type N-terminal cleavage/methylation domain-containing protein [Thermodesulfovibrionales bacterium]|nr:prepilin-type N-terminal cleavage/methylation domain-containing protein [Thermodesulfovibrionales bacterium]
MPIQDSRYKILDAPLNPPLPWGELKGGRASGIRNHAPRAEWGFTLLEVLVALAVLGIAVTMVLQLFSADMRAISASGDYVSAVARAESKMREVLADDALSEKSSGETARDGYRTSVSVTQTLRDRTENLQVILLNVSVTVYWTRGSKEKSLTLNTMKTVNKQI